ncbi:hypothetical protein P691DRAFT_781362 [Macrolepiota fuliginosa MF-IS2]|uniref:Uncharacterized protein n=1 Tax=Macrolepiota fuliginosa MF-IS2 TaxID=1400762 RepID=A0A9P5XMT0_9AGAR|nr:hypothetical protein P691DRAFT_781362 [Macrolepiota fuliginosa MF-IS2]
MVLRAFSTAGFHSLAPAPVLERGMCAGLSPRVSGYWIIELGTRTLLLDIGTEVVSAPPICSVLSMGGASRVLAEGRSEKLRAPGIEVVIERIYGRDVKRLRTPKCGNLCALVSNNGTYVPPRSKVYENMMPNGRRIGYIAVFPEDRQRVRCWYPFGRMRKDILGLDVLIGLGRPDFCDLSVVFWAVRRWGFVDQLVVAFNVPSLVVFWLPAIDDPTFIGTRDDPRATNGPHD